MSNWRHWILALMVALILASCQTFQTPMVKEGNQERWADFNPDGVDYIATCRILIKTPEDSNSGSCRIQLTRDKQIRLTVFVAIGGTVLDAYIDKSEIRIIEPATKTFYILENNKDSRSLIPILSDIDIDGFRSIFWGQNLGNDNPGIRFTYVDGKPRQASGFKNKSVRVTYTSWLDFHTHWIPKTIRLDTPDINQQVKIVITHFRPGIAENTVIEAAPDGYKEVRELSILTRDDG